MKKNNKVLVGFEFQDELEDALFRLGAKHISFVFEDSINPESDFFDEDIYNACCDEVLGEYKYPLLFEFLYCDLEKEKIRSTYREILSRHMNEMNAYYRES